jgi:glutamate racemase
MMADSAVKIGVFDSGLGGLSVLRELRRLIPSQPMIYIGDQIHTPYGIRTLEEVRRLTTEAVQFLFRHDARLIVVACNTASAAALKSLRVKFPDVPFVGMEPAVKPAAEQTHSGVVGVLATYATFQSELYASVVERFAKDVTVLQSPCPGLVAEIEKGNLTGPETREILQRELNPMLEKGIDTVVLGCTHYPFVIPLIKEIVGPDVRVIDPAPAVAKQTAHLLSEHGWLAESGHGKGKLYTTGKPLLLQNLLPILIGETGKVAQATWIGDRLV